MKISHTNWRLFANTKEEKQALFDYAAKKGIGEGGYSKAMNPRIDCDLWVLWYVDGLWSAHKGYTEYAEQDPAHGPTHRISQDEFRQMCDDYALEN